MGREVRKVPADWQHPKDELTGNYRPLFNGADYAEKAAGFMEKANAEGLQEAVDWYGCVDQNDYMPVWTPEQATHFMMYEDSTEGTPISPAFATPEELASWLADTGASAFGSSTGSYEGWLRVARGGFACSMVVTDGVIKSGVDGLTA